VKHHGTLVAEIPNRALTDEAPLYTRPMSPPEYLADVQTLDLDSLRGPQALRDQNAALLAILGAPTVASKHWVYRQYDHMVRTNTINLPGLGAGVVRVKGTDRALAMSVDGNGRYCYLDPYRGAMLAVAEAARNVACSGATPLGATNCLNFGNPERPAIMWQFAKAVEGIGAACRALGVPSPAATSASTTKPTGRRSIRRRRSASSACSSTRTAWSRANSVMPATRLFCSARAAESSRIRVPQSRVRRRARRAACSGSGRRACAAGTARSARTRTSAAVGARLFGRRDRCHAGECCFGTGGIGAEVSIDGVRVASDGRLNVAAALYGESASRVVVSVVPDAVTTVLERAAAANVPARVIGQTGGNRLRMAVAGQIVADASVDEAERVWSSAIEQAYAKRVA